MNRTPVRLAAIATVLLAVSASAQKPLSASEEMQFVQFLVGTWSCAHTVGDFSGRYTTTYASTLGDRWLKQAYDFPATAEDAAVHAEYFLGYDVRNQSWVRFGAHNNAQYYGMVGKRAENVWSWRYVLPGTSGSAVWTKRSDVEYTVDGPTYPQNGKLVTEQHTCRKGS
jgi:hypothetical protein